MADVFFRKGKRSIAEGKVYIIEKFFPNYFAFFMFKGFLRTFKIQRNPLFILLKLSDFFTDPFCLYYLSGFILFVNPKTYSGETL